MKAEALVLQTVLWITVAVPTLFFGGEPRWFSSAVSSLLFFSLFLNPNLFKTTVSSLPRVFWIGSVAVFLFLLFQAFALSAYPPATRFEGLRWLAYGCTFILVQGLDRSAIVRILYVLAFIAVLESAVGFWQVLGGQEYVLWIPKERHLGYATGTYFNRNHLAGLFELALGIQLGLLYRAWTAGHRLLFTGLAIFIAITTAGLAMTGSRMGVLSFAVAAALMSFFIRTHKKVTVAVFVLGLILCAGVLNGGMFQSRVQEVQEHFETWDGGRITAWKDGMKALSDYRWGGAGLGNFAWIFPRYQSSELEFGWHHAHNDYLELAIELGLPAFALWMAAWAALGYRSMKNLARFSDDRFPLAWGILIGITSLTLHGLTDFNFAIFSNMVLYVILWSFLLRFYAMDSTV